MQRREFIKEAGLGSAALLAAPTLHPSIEQNSARLLPTKVSPNVPALDLSPATWIWYPSERCLPNTFVCFRREVELTDVPTRATGWILADSRYRLEVNGKRIQWGPAPSDPRWPEADPLDLTDCLHKGQNVLGVLVLFFGQGDGTWAAGKPGLLFRLELEYPDGRKQLLVSDSTWMSRIAMSWQPGHYKRWYLRSLQEEFDARRYPYGWSSPGYSPDPDWLSAMPLKGVTAALPSLCSSYPEYAFDLRGNDSVCAIRPRSIPLVRESLVPAHQLVEAYSIHWRRTPEEFFSCLTPDSFDAEPIAAELESDGSLGLKLDGSGAIAVTFKFKEELVGWPYFTITAPEGTVIELMVQEHHAPGKAVLLNSHFHSWSRFICREGLNTFETFDYEACMWLQLHVHGAQGSVRIRDVGVRRRSFPWKTQPQILCSDPAIQTLALASINTLINSAQETAVDGMGRERQQYSGDGSHQLHALYYAFGESRLPARFISTFSQGITQDGFFLDCWPAYDRLARLWERQIQASYWGPLVDHGIGFAFDCWHHYMYTGDQEALREPYPRLLRFFDYLKGLRRSSDGLIPVENLGVPSVYIDHLAYKKQRHKECALNLYAGAMLIHALAPLCDVFGDAEWAAAARATGRDLVAATIRRYWSKSQGVFVANAPWRMEEGETRYCDRSLALGILFDLCPGGETQKAAELLVRCPPELGLSYPANTCWRTWALAKSGRADAILSDFRSRWMGMESVGANNTLQEFWNERPDGGSVMSHCGVVPLYSLFMDIAGIRPIAPGFTKCRIRPQLDDLEKLELAAHTVRGLILFSANGRKGNRSLSLTLPEGCATELQVDPRERLLLPGTGSPGMYLLPAGRTSIVLRYS